jgi:NADH dehydrogenase [ubiquinone] 1 alpha subcomplex assembly factor 1
MNHECSYDDSLHEYLALRVRAGGDPTTRDSYYVNLQTEGPISTDLWQHRLYLRRTDGDWEDIYIPFGSFRLTNSGELVNSDTEMGRDQVRSVGISLLGGNSGVQGKYALDVDSISLVNEVDVGGVGKRSVGEEEDSKGIDLKDLLPNPPGPVPLPGATSNTQQ